MNIKSKNLKSFLSKASFAECGDTYEKKYGHHLSAHFPNCEEFWKFFVVPMTRRMDGFPNKPLNNINLRKSIASEEIEDIANAHYSMFLNLIFAHIHFETEMVSSLENIYTHLGSVCDLAETVMEKWYLLSLVCQEKQSDTLQKLGREEFLEIAGEWYDENYPTLYQHYLSKGKSPPVRLISRDNILVEYFGKEPKIRKAYARQSQLIRTFRNVVVHDLKVGRIAEASGRLLIPKPEVIHRYRTWRDIVAALADDDVVKKDFVEQYYQAKNDIVALEEVLNSLWELLLDDFTNEFYHASRDTLRNLFDITFSPKSVNIGTSSSNQRDNFTVRTSGSYPGQYSGGSAIYRWEDDKKDQ
jgi:hypothetical protein